MYVCMHVCVFICTYACIYIRTYVHTYVCMYSGTCQIEHLCTLNTCVHWTIFHVPAHSHWNSMGGYLDTLNTCLSWTLNTKFVPAGHFYLSTLNILHWFETFYWKMRSKEIYKINCCVKWYFSNAEHVKFLTIWRKWGKHMVDFAIKWSCYSNYPWIWLSFTRPPNTQNLDTLNTCVHWTLFHFPWVFNVDRFHCIYVCMYVCMYV